MDRLVYGMLVTALLASGGCARSTEPPVAEPSAVPTAVRQTRPPPGPAPAVGESAHTIGKTAAGAALAAKVETSLIDLGGLPMGDVDVEATPEGAITLQGSVPGEAEKRRIEEAVLQVEGVRSVRNALTVAE
jgi:hypothetical protein